MSALPEKKIDIGYVDVWNTLKRYDIKPEHLSDAALHKWEEFIRKIINEERAFACPKCGYRHDEYNERDGVMG